MTTLRFRGTVWMRLRLSGSLDEQLRLLIVALVATHALSAHAAGSGMPWESPLEAILASVQGPVARIMAVMTIIGTGLALAFGESSGGVRKLLQIVFGLSIAFAASSFFLSFLGFAGGAVIA